MGQEREEFLFSCVVFLQFPVQTCVRICQDLEGGKYGECAAKITEYKTRCRQVFPYAVTFMSADELQQLTAGLEQMNLTPEGAINGHGGETGEEA